MELPDLERIVDTYVPIPRNISRDDYTNRLRADIIPEINKLNEERRIVWYCFLIHEWRHLEHKKRTPPNEPNAYQYIHLRFGLPEEIIISDFIASLADHFEQPIPRPVSEIYGAIDKRVLKDCDWAYAWLILGEASDWVLKMIEGHDENSSIPIEQVIQFLHFITNPLKIDNNCIFLPGGYIPF